MRECLTLHGLCTYLQQSEGACSWGAGETDYVVDALALHDHLHILRGVFADPGITKVLHGGDNDILWLQRDFHLYIVNAFDTEKACQVSLPASAPSPRNVLDGCSLAFLRRGCLADLRMSSIRPHTESCLVMALIQVSYCMLQRLQRRGARDGQPAPLPPYPKQVHGIGHIVPTGMLQVLGREERSLASLLNELCGVRKQKQHQRADWRQRCINTRLLCPPPLQHLRSLGTPPHIRDG